MAALAVAAGGQLETIRWADSDRPGGCGLIVFGDGVGAVDILGSPFPVDAMCWGPGPGGVAVTLSPGRRFFQPRWSPLVTIGLVPGYGREGRMRSTPPAG